jgi:hypothetical protein
MNKNYNIIATFSLTTPWEAWKSQLVTSTYLSEIDTYNKLFKNQGGNFNSKEVDKNLKSLKTGIYYRLIGVKNISDEEVKYDNSIESKTLKSLSVTYTNYTSFFKSRYLRGDFNDLISSTNYQQTIVIFYDTN